MTLNQALLHRAAKPVLFALALLPLAWLFYAAAATSWALTRPRR